MTSGLKVLLYGSSGTGKTTTWATFPKPILALICSGGNQPGELRSINTPEYRKTIDARVLTKIEEVNELLEDAGQFKTLVLDHVSGLQDMTLAGILGMEELPAQKHWGLATKQQYAQCTAQCKEVLRKMLGMDQHVVIIGQERVFGGKDDGMDPELIQPKIGVAVTPSLAGWLMPACDYVMQAYLRPKMEQVETVIGKDVIVTQKRGRGQEYCARTEPHDVISTKFRVPLGGKNLPECIVDPSYDKITAIIEGR